MEHLRLRHLDGQAWLNETTQQVGTIRREDNGDISFEYKDDDGHPRIVRRARHDVTLVQPDLMRSVVERQRLGGLVSSRRWWWEG